MSSRFARGGRKARGKRIKIINGMEILTHHKAGRKLAGVYHAYSKPDGSLLKHIEHHKMKEVLIKSVEARPSL
jgi:hypothetical protein